MNDAASKTLPEALAKFRTGAIAEALGVSPQAVSSYRNGQSFPGLDKLEPLAAFLGIEISDLVRMASLHRKSA